MKKTEIIILTIALIGACLIGAVWAWKGNSPETAKNNVQKQDIVNQVTENQNSNVDTSDWKTYRNDEYGFEMKYPSKYLEKADNSIKYLYNINFYDESQEGLLALTVNLSNRAKWTLIERKKINESQKSEKVITEDIEINDIPALMTKFGGTPQSAPVDEIYLLRNGKSYTLSFSSANDNGSLERQIIQSIILN